MLHDLLGWTARRPTDRVTSATAEPFVVATTPTCFGQTATKIGTAGNDTIMGTAGADVIVGLGGNDLIYGHGGNDLICAGDGNDVMLPGAGNDRVSGGNGSDTVSYATASAGVHVSLGTTSAQVTGQGTDSLSSVESLTGSPYGDSLVGSSGPNRLSGGGGNDTLLGEGDNDTLLGGSGNDALYGGAGNDTLAGNTGTDSYGGGSGSDTVRFAGASRGVVANLATGSSHGEGSTSTAIEPLSSIENLIGSSYNDSFTGSNVANELRGGPGSDTLRGGSGSDVLVGGGSDATICGGAGNDKLYGQGGIDILLGGPGNDLLDGGSADPIELDLAFYACAKAGVTVNLGAGTSSGLGTDVLTGVDGIVGSFYDDNLVGNDGLNLYAGLKGDDQIDGKGGFDVALFLTAPAGVNVDLGIGGASGEGTDTLSSIESAFGTDLADLLTGDSNANLLIGAAGNDTINGLGGDDVIAGGEGNDVLAGDGGNDLLVGDAGDDSMSGGAGAADVASYTTAPGPIVANLAVGTASGEGSDTLSGVENLAGSTFGDVLSGDSGSNRLYGIGGSDTLNGGNGPDFLYGGPGDDQLHGGAGADFLDGGDGAADTNDGGPDPDTCIGAETTVNCEGDGTGSALLSAATRTTPTGVGSRSPDAATGGSHVGSALPSHADVASSVPLAHSNDWFTYTNPSTQCKSTTDLVTDMPAGVTVDSAATGQEWIWYQSYLYSTADPATELAHSEFFYSPQQPGYQTTKWWYRYADDTLLPWTVTFTIEPTHDYYVVFQLWWEDGNGNFFATERYRAEEALGWGAFGQYCPASIAYITIGGPGYGSLAYNCDGLNDESCVFYLEFLATMNSAMVAPWVQ